MNDGKEKNMQKYNPAIRVLHWAMALVILTLVAVGWYMTDLPKEDPNRMAIYGYHKAFGVLVLLLLAARVGSRLIFKAPALPDAIKPAERKLAHLGHFALYLLMLGVPLSGIIMSNAFGYPASFFGIPLPFIVEKNEELGKFFREIHGIVPYVLLGLVALHVAGVVKHKIVEKINLLTRMI